MPLIEWTFIAGLPTLLCIKILVDGHVPSASLFPLLSSESSLASTTCASNAIVIDDSLQWPLSALVATSILSLIAILLFGDAKESDESDNSGLRGHCRNRGVGIVMGSNLVPLHYMAFLLSTSRGGRAIKNDPLTPMTVRSLYQFEFASMGGLAFAVSFLWMKWSRCNHRKYNSRRLNGDDGAVQNNGDCVDRTRLNEEESIRLATLMGICWKIYASLIVFQSAWCAHLYDCDVSTPTLGSLHIVLIWLYDKKTSTMNHDGNLMIQDASWQEAFTPGEWMVVSTLITSLVGEYILQHSGIRNNAAAAASPFNNSLPIHITVAHAGFIGCLVGVTICSFLNKFSVMGRDNGVMGMAASLVVVAAVTIGCLETALNSRLNESSLYCDLESITCSNSSASFGGYRIPLSVVWLFHFLTSKVDVPTNTGSVSVVRAVFLAYWASVLAVCIPMASHLTSWITAAARSNNLDENMNNGANVNYSNNHHGNTRKKRVIIARKYFHIVAILLFTPITWLDPDMMSLSYAIAISLLIVTEMVRGWMISDDDKKGTFNITDSTSSWNGFYIAFLDEKDSSAAKGGLAVTHIALIMGCAFSLWVNQLLQQTYTSSAAGWSPLRSPADTWFSSDEKFLAQLPYLGLVVLGIGDSVGAIYGINFGRHNWPGGTARTLEGSLCMFFSMVLVFLLNVTGSKCHYTFQVSVTMLAMTLIEASTSQIDNLCLPVAGSTLVLLLTVLGD
jgi:dolichol kinase